MTAIAERDLEEVQRATPARNAARGLVLLDDRTYDTSLATAEKQPTWTKIDAVAAGAITPWPAYWVSTYADYAEQLDALSDAIEKIDPDLT